jgi:hypothetical protein
MERACAQMRSWRDAGLNIPLAALNVRGQIDRLHGVCAVYGSLTGTLQASERAAVGEHHYFDFMARPAGLEPTTTGLEERFFRYRA